MKQKNIWLFVGIILFLIAIDQGIKYIVMSHLQLVDSIHVIRNFFRITYVANTGGAWSILAGNTGFLIGIGILVSGILIYVWYRQKTLENTILYGTLLGGILGNLIDRIRLGYVVDYLDFNFASYQFPIFNLADILIVLSVIYMLVKLCKEEKSNGNSNNRKSREKN